MTEFERYGITDESRERMSFSREIPEETRTGEDAPACIVSHPDAGGACGRPAVYEVWALPFCELHGLEANALALEELYHDAGDELERWQNPHAQPLNSEVQMIVRSGVKWTSKRWEHHHERAERLVQEAYPVIDERVAPETTGWDPYSLDDEAPVDRWSETRFLLARFMREAFSEYAYTVIEDLEPMRERACAQLVAAEADSERKLGPREERLAAREAAEVRRDPVTDALASVNRVLGSASNRLSEDVPLTAFADEEDYWRASRAIAEAGGLVVRAETLRRKQGNDDQPA